MAKKTDNGLKGSLYADEALRIYKKLKNEQKTKEMQELHDKLSANIQLQTFSVPLPEEYVKELESSTQQLVSSADERTAVKNIFTQPWFLSLETIKETAERQKRTSLLSVLTKNAFLDKFGNTINTFYTDEEDADMHFWNVYRTSYVLGIDKLHRYVIEAYKSGKLTYENTMDFLSSTWLGQSFKMKFLSGVTDVKITDVLRPSLKLLFDELEKSVKDCNYKMDYILIEDSLTQKIEYILRYYLINVGHPTSRPKQKRTKPVEMQMLLDEILAELKDTPSHPTGFKEEDRIFIKYLCTPVGENQRNRIAHGMMDAQEYSFYGILAAFYIIMRLSSYTISPHNHRRFKISVCMATFNGEKYLKEQVDSILPQLEPNDELIISDDGSRDNTINIVNAFNDTRIKLLINNGEHGFVHNFENALNNAKGDVIFLSDQDDIWRPNKVSKSVDELSGCDMIVHNAEIIDGDGNPKGYDYFSKLHRHTGFWWNLYKTRCLGCCMVFKKSLLDECMPLPRKIVAHDYWIGMYALYRFKVKFVEDKLIGYRRHGSNLSPSSEKSKDSLYRKIFVKRLNLLLNILIRSIPIRHNIG